MSGTYLESLRSSLRILLRENQRTVLLGEDIIDPYGGAFKVTAGLSTEFPDQVLTTPISEAAITGVGTGLALRGYRPIVEIMFGDFLTLCADQLVNHATKFPLMFPETNCPLVIRTPMGGGRGYGPTHSQSLEKMFFGIPGLKIYYPSLFHDPGMVLRSIVTSETQPVLFLEHKLLYSEKLISSSESIFIDYLDDADGTPIAAVKNFTNGVADVCVITYGGISRHINKLLPELAAEEIRVLALIPSRIDPVSIGLIASLVSSIGRVVVADEGYADFSWSDGVASKIYNACWSNLHAPIKVISSKRSIIPTSSSQEELILIDKKKIEEAILEALS